MPFIGTPHSRGNNRTLYQMMYQCSSQNCYAYLRKTFVVQAIQKLLYNAIIFGDASTLHANFWVTNNNPYLTKFAMKLLFSIFK